MEQFRKQTAGQDSSPTDPQKTNSSSSTGPTSVGMMQLPGKRGGRSGGYPRDLVPGGMSDSTYEANMLGELAVISIGDQHDVRTQFVGVFGGVSPCHFIVGAGLYRN